MSELEVDKSALSEICKRYGVRSLFLFGSYVRNQVRDTSDIDLLVRFSQPASLLDLVALERELSELFGRSVDLQTEAALSPYIRDSVLKERQILYAA